MRISAHAWHYLRKKLKQLVQEKPDCVGITLGELEYAIARDQHEHVLATLFPDEMSKPRGPAMFFQGIPVWEMDAETGIRILVRREAK